MTWSSDLWTMCCVIYVKNLITYCSLKFLKLGRDSQCLKSINNIWSIALDIYNLFFFLIKIKWKAYKITKVQNFIWLVAKKFCTRGWSNILRHGTVEGTLKWWYRESFMKTLSKVILAHELPEISCARIDISNL